MTDCAARFFVGSMAEAGEVEAAGFTATVCSEMDAGQIATEVIRLARLDVPCVSLLSEEGGRELADACEQAGTVCLVVDQRRIREAFQGGAVADLCAAVAAELNEDLEEARSEARRRQLERKGVYHVTDVAYELACGKADREPIPTGLEALDNALGGGLPTGGLVTLGAISSTGKTTLALQIADHMAAAGNVVLFVTVEQGRHELAAKSLSRLMKQAARKNGGMTSATGTDIQRQEIRSKWSSETKKAFDAACSEYVRTIAPRMRMMEKDGQPTTAQIIEAAELIRRQEGKAPIVFIDYLQLLAPAAERMTERQAIDHNVMDLRHLARDMRTCVLAISSLNRASYGEGVTLEAFKESGSIEYGSDVLLGLQPFGLGEQVKNTKVEEQRKQTRTSIEDYKSRAIREAEIKVLKNRGGAMPRESVSLTYDAASNLFVCSKAQPAQRTQKRAR